MSYSDMADLATDAEFGERLAFAVVEQAKTHDPSEYVAEASLRAPANGSNMFMPFVAVEPGFAEAYATGGQESITDLQLLSAVQANWDAVAAVWNPITTPVTP